MFLGAPGPLKSNLRWRADKWTKRLITSDHGVYQNVFITMTVSVTNHKVPNRTHLWYYI